jgi:glycosyltransferase involved in cell wall biosynthesis
MKTSVIVLTKNSAPLVKQTMDSLMPFYRQGFITEIITVDGYSTDDTADIVRQYPVKILLEDKQRPFPAAARDIGWRASKGDLVIYLDSDGYLGKGFFPHIYTFFMDDRVGIVGCEDHTVITNGLSKAHAQQREFLYHLNMPNPPIFAKIYRWLQRMPKEIYIGGACHVIRRSCLEDIGGFPLHDCGEDVSLAQKIVAAGWKNLWWSQSPIHHNLPFTYKGLLRQYFRHGRQGAIWEIEVRQKSRIALILDFHHVVSIGVRLASPVFGIVLAVLYMNPRHLIVYPFCRYAWLAGYLKVFFYI